MAIPKVGDVITLDGMPCVGSWSPLAGQHRHWIVESARSGTVYIFVVLRDINTGKIAPRSPYTSRDNDNEWPLLEQEMVIDPFLSAVHRRRQLPQSQPTKEK